MIAGQLLFSKQNMLFYHFIVEITPINDKITAI